MTHPIAAGRRAPAAGAGVATVSALIVLLALIAIPYHFGQGDAGGQDQPRVQDWRGNSAALDTLR